MRVVAVTAKNGPGGRGRGRAVYGEAPEAVQDGDEPEEQGLDGRYWDGAHHC